MDLPDDDPQSLRHWWYSPWRWHWGIWIMLVPMGFLWLLLCTYILFRTF
jgi:hypothetical protein